jgi:4-hydroxythreonine-4-phosphate dehydrogenase
VTRPRLALTVGDPAGIGPEIALRVAARPREDVELVLYGSRSALEACAERLSLPRLRVPLVDPCPEPPPPPGACSAAGGRAAAEAVLAAARDALSGSVDGLVTAPLNKASLREAGYSWPGHTELLAEVSGVDDVAMLFVAGELRVALLTIHQSLRSVADSLTRERVERVVRLVARELPGLGARRTRLALCGLNPHAGEGGLFGREELDTLMPAAERLRAEGIDLLGPAPADTLFVRAQRGEFDAVIACYHDQGLIPAKLAGFGSAVNVTLGLPFVRTSVDHGTAFDIAERGGADPGSLEAALSLAAALVAARGSR